ncbi:MAG: hypothetical protein H6807_09095 [Planctomycetes bacterium]|nr:hypothetical protein [Planctomycetota bacterium]
MIRPGLVLALALLLPALGCSSFSGRNLNDRPPALVDMEEPLEFRGEPDDEPARQELPRRAFSGIVPGETGESMEDLFDGEPGLLVAAIVENSPAAFADLEPGDLLLEARVAGAEPIELRWPSEWYAIEEARAPGTEIELLYDRAGRERRGVLVLAQRHRAPERLAGDRFREEDKVGVVLRSATEVEAATAGLPAGAGAVVVGLSRRSPWRAAGLLFGDLIRTVAGEPVLHPQVVLDAIRAGDEGLELAIQRGGEVLEIEAPLSRRDSELSDFDIPLLLSYESEGERSDFELLYGLIGYEETAAEWQFTLLWLIHFGGGDTEELEKVDN